MTAQGLHLRPPRRQVVEHGLQLLCGERRRPGGHRGDLRHRRHRRSLRQHASGDTRGGGPAAHEAVGHGVQLAGQVGGIPDQPGPFLGHVSAHIMPRSSPASRRRPRR